MVLPWEQLQLSPQSAFGLPPCTTALPTSIGSGRNKFVMSFEVHYIFYEFFTAMLHVFSFKLLWSQHGTGKNSAHRLSLASRPAPPPCQHQWAVACIFWRLDLNSFTFFANVSFTTSDIFSITYFLCHDGKGENSANRLSLASRPAPPPCQHQWAAAGLFWRLI